MNELTATFQTMTSREIAGLTGKRHADVMRDIRVMIERLEADADLRWHCETETYADAQGKPREQYRLDRDTTLTLVTGYDPIPRMKIIKRWQELESGQSIPSQPAPIAAPEQAAAAALDGTLRAATLLGVPLHLAQIESVKAVRLAHRVDFSPLLTHAPAQSDVPELEIMLEPTELAERLGVPSARAMNAILRDSGLQTKANGEWRPTEKGNPMCTRHAWSRGDKSGYNLKWRLTPVRRALAPRLVQKSA